MSRDSWEVHHLKAAVLASEMGTCKSNSNKGAVFIRDNRILSTGFNGVPSGFPHPTVCKRKELGIAKGEELNMCGCAHAEMNAICNAAKEGVSLTGSTLYCTSEPCNMCMGAIANVGVKKVVYIKPYHHAMSAEIAKYASIEVIRHISELV